MVFSSTVFLFIFLPVTYVLYLLMPGIKAKNVWLIVISLLFYAFGEPLTVFLMVFSVLANYIFARLIASNKHKKPWLAAAVIFDLGILGVFKYAGFFVQTINAVLPVTLPVPQIRLPIGISFFTFQILSYVIDVYRDSSLVQKKFGNVLLYISLFPQLIAGPIVKYYDIAKQIGERRITAEETALGIRRFITGLSKKVLIANTVGAAADAMFALSAENMSAPTCWLGAVAYTLQIYYDFSGYSDMAIGLGHMLGFTFKENFDHPYIAASMQDFWRRWHISLSTWFKEYLYIPLGGNRKGRLRTAVNKIIVFFCTGLWHGANMTFVVWGLLHGLFLMLESYKAIPLEKLSAKPLRPLKHIYTLLVVTVTFVIFRAETLTKAWQYIAAMFTGFTPNAASMSAFSQQLSPLFITAALTAVVFSAPVSAFVRGRAATLTKGRRAAASACAYAVSLVMLVLCIINLACATFNPFIYLQF